MAASTEARLGPDEFVIPLSRIEAAQLRKLATAWGLTPEEALIWMVTNQLNQCAAAVVDLHPQAARVTH